jgi:predicted O-linked N-acetylglucosamine transferase (SPINDLY family)
MLDQDAQRAMQLALAGQISQALPILERILTQDPKHLEANRLMGLSLFHIGRFEPALMHLKRAAEIAPNRGDIWGAMASIYSSLNRHDDAITVARRAVEVSPNLPEAHALLATLLLQASDYEGAELHYEHAIRLKPDYVEARTNHAVIYEMTGRARQSVDLLRAATLEFPFSLPLLTNYCVALNYTDAIDPKETHDAHVRYGRMLLAQPPAGPPVAQWPNRRDPDRRLRVGILSPDFFDHSVSYFLAPILQHHNRAAVEYICYHTSPKVDWMTQRLGKNADGWRDMSKANDKVLVQQIRDDQCDIVVELSGQTFGNRLLALRARAAPIQATYCGYPNTTGLPTIDYRIVDSITDPPGSEKWAVEKLARLDPCFLCFSVERETPPVEDPPFLQNGHITFGSFNSIKKITPTGVRLWAELLHAVPTARLVVKSQGLHGKTARNAVATVLKESGIPEVRFELLPRIENKNDHMNAYGAIDIAVDTYPYHGTTTTCEALWMGVPVITLAGPLHASRVSASLLNAVGLPELVAHTPEEFAKIGAALANDRDRLTDLRRGMRQRMLSSPLCDGPAFCRRFENALREMWRAWCAAPASASRP